MHKLPALEVADLSSCVHLEAAQSLDNMAKQGFPALKARGSGHGWLRVGQSLEQEAERDINRAASE